MSWRKKKDWEVEEKECMVVVVVLGAIVAVVAGSRIAEVAIDLLELVTTAG